MTNLHNLVQFSRTPEFVYRIAVVATALLLLLTFFRP